VNRQIPTLHSEVRSETVGSVGIVAALKL